MATVEKMDGVSIQVSDQGGSTSDKPGYQATLIEQQTRTRRLFSMPQLFAFSLVYLGTWYSVAMYVIRLKRMAALASKQDG